MPAPALNFVPMSQLDGVNGMLLSIGQAPVSTLVVSGIKDVSIANLILHNTSREVQTRGWNFNTDSEFLLSRDINGKIAVPDNALSIDPCDPSLDYVQRRDITDNVIRLYDKDGHTFVLADDVKVDITWFYQFEDLPQAARAYIAAKAGRIFQAQAVGSQILWQYTEEREKETLSELQRDELRSSDANMFLTDPGITRIVFRDRIF